jgi:hypothetical protein
MCMTAAEMRVVRYVLGREEVGNPAIVTIGKS